MKVHGFICTTPVYEYKGWIFEFHRYLGPWPLRKDLEPRARAGKKFWDLFGEFYDLPESEQKKFRLNEGGCQQF